jgi:hypothetical protein
MGGKSSAPAAPDYVGQAQATAAGNLAAARSQTSANRIDQITPYGNINYTQGDGFDQAGYDAAMSKYNSQQQQLQQNAGLQEYFGKTGQLLTAPDKNSFMTNPDHWSSQIQLSDTGQKLLDAANQTSLGLSGLQNSAMGRVQDTLSQPFDMSGVQDMTTDNSGAVNGYNDYVKSLQGGITNYNDYVKSLQGGVDPNTGMDAWTAATNLVRQRQEPQLNSQQALLDTKLANQGLTPGSAGWALQQSQFGQQRNDADMAAQLTGLQAQQQFFGQAVQNQGLKQNVAGLMGQGIGYGSNQAGLLGQGVGYGFQNAGLNNASRQQQLTERATLRQLPLNELNAIRSGAQVTNPTFSTPGQQGQTSGPDLAGAGSAQYNAALNQTNAQNAQAASNTQAGVGLAGTAIMAAAMY